jgi:DNA-packaging protein gp3
MTHPGWRPPEYENASELQAQVDKYFEWGYRKKKMYNSEGKEYEIPAITITDLAIFLWFASRQSIYDYSEKGEFSYIIKRAQLFIEREYEERLSWTSPTGAIFALKNMWWKDKSETDITSKWEKIGSYSDVSLEELKDRTKKSLS